MNPIVIAGAGPAGCAVALYLAKNNLPVILLEGRADLPLDLRASTFHPPTLDMLSRLDLTEPMIEQGLIVPSYQYRDRRTNEVAEFNLERLEGETKFPFRLQCEQFKMTRLTVEMLESMPNVEVRFSHQVVGCSERSDRVDVLCYTDKGEVRIPASFLIGADGADSNVRRSSGVMYDGSTYPERFLVASTTFPFEEHFDNLAWVNYVSDPDEWCVLLKTVDLWRVLVPTPIREDGERFLSDEYIQSRLQRLISTDGDYDVVHRTLYRVHQRVAERYRVRDRVLLVGDAAHINNPLGGMGMNGGVHDAINLAEKLVASAENGGDYDELLNLYERQRREICVKFVQEHTKSNKALMEATEEKTQTKRQADLMKACSDPDLEKSFLMRTSMINSVRESYAIQ
ncbi:MAG: NAD(P)/FAD-dependent oxidoreductase [Pseudomonadota bacterium]